MMIRILFDDRSGRREPIHDRHAEIHEYNVRPERLVLLERFLTISCLADDFQTGLGREERN
jgi:hypothetical protein